MSTTCNVVRLVGEEMNYERLFIIDSQNLSTGIGLQVLYAARLAEEGKSAEEITSLVNARRGKANASFVVDTLTYLARGGRCNAVTALLANTLKLKPEIVKALIEAAVIAMKELAKAPEKIEGDEAKK